MLIHKLAQTQISNKYNINKLVLKGSEGNKVFRYVCFSRPIRLFRNNPDTYFNANIKNIELIQVLNKLVLDRLIFFYNKSIFLDRQ